MIVICYRAVELPVIEKSFLFYTSTVVPADIESLFFIIFIEANAANFFGPCWSLANKNTVSLLQLVISDLPGILTHRGSAHLMVVDQRPTIAKATNFYTNPNSVLRSRT